MFTKKSHISLGLWIRHYCVFGHTKVIYTAELEIKFQTALFLSGTHPSHLRPYRDLNLSRFRSLSLSTLNSNMFHSSMPFSPTAMRNSMSKYRTFLLGRSVALKLDHVSESQVMLTLLVWRLHFEKHWYRLHFSPALPGLPQVYLCSSTD